MRSSIVLLIIVNTVSKRTAPFAALLTSALEIGHLVATRDVVEGGARLGWCGINKAIQSIAGFILVVVDRCIQRHDRPADADSYRPRLVQQPLDARQ